MKAKTFYCCVAMMAAVLGGTSARAQSGGQFEASWSTIDGGGGSSASGRFSVSGTIGQPDAGKLAGGRFELEGGFWGGVQVLQTPGAPLLKIKMVGANAVISWPVSITGFNLEQTTNPGLDLWTPAVYAVVDTATEHTVTVPAIGAKCFRLKNPSEGGPN